MTIKLTVNLPVGNEHGMTKGKVLETIPNADGQKGVWVMGEAGEKVKILMHEYEVV